MRRIRISLTTAGQVSASALRGMQAAGRLATGAASILLSACATLPDVLEDLAVIYLYHLCDSEDAIGVDLPELGMAHFYLDSTHVAGLGHSTYTRNDAQPLFGCDKANRGDNGGN